MSLSIDKKNIIIIIIIIIITFVITFSLITYFVSYRIHNSEIENLNKLHLNEISTIEEKNNNYLIIYLL